MTNGTLKSLPYPLLTGAAVVEAVLDFTGGNVAFIDGSTVIQGQVGDATDGENVVVTILRDQGTIPVRLRKPPVTVTMATAVEIEGGAVEITWHTGAKLVLTPPNLVVEISSGEAQ